MSDTAKTGWTLGTLKALMDERDRRYTDVAQEREKAIALAVQSVERALTIAEASAEKWREAANEWRGAMEDRERNFISKSVGNIYGALAAIAVLIAIMDKLK